MLTQQKTEGEKWIRDTEERRDVDDGAEEKQDPFQAFLVQKAPAFQS